MDVKQTKVSCLVGKSVKWYNYFWNWKFLIKSNIYLPYGPNISTSMCLLKRNENKCLSNRWIKMLRATLLMIARDWKQYKCSSIGECIVQLGYRHAIEYNTIFRNKND